MRHEDGTFDNVEIAKFEASMFGLLANDEQHADDPAAAAHHRIWAWRDYYTMCGQAAALTAMSHALEAAVAGRTDEAAERYRKALQAFERSGGQYDRDLEHAAEQAGNRLLAASAAGGEPSIPPDQVVRFADDAIGLFLEYRDLHGRDEDAAKHAALQEVAEGVDQLVHQRDVEAERGGWRAGYELISRSEAAFQEGKDEGRLEVSAAVEALCEQWQRQAEDTVNHTPSAYMPDQYRRTALLRCSNDGRALVNGDTSALEQIRQADRERIAQRIEDAADPVFADEYAALEWAARVARDDGSDGQDAEPTAGGPSHGPQAADRSATDGADGAHDVAAAATVPEAQVQLALDRLRNRNDEAPARPYATGHYLMTDDQWQMAVGELRRRGRVISEFTWTGDEDAYIAAGERCYRLVDVRPAPNADERRARAEREERISNAHFAWANAHTGGDFWASPEAAALDLDPAVAEPVGDEAPYVAGSRGRQATTAYVVTEPDAGTDEHTLRFDDVDLTADDADVYDGPEFDDNGGAHVGGLGDDAYGADEPVQVPKAAGTRDRESDPTVQSSDSEAAVHESTNDRADSDADDELPDGGRSPTPDETHDAVDSAERAVLELKGRRAWEEQYAQARDCDDQVTAWQVTSSTAEDTRRVGQGPVLSAFDDE